MNDDVLRLDRIDGLDRERSRWLTDAERLRSALTEAEAAAISARDESAAATARLDALRQDERAGQRRVDELRAKLASAVRVLETGVGNAEAAERQRVNCVELIDQTETTMLESLEAQDRARAELDAAKAKLVRADQVAATARKEMPPRIEELAATALRLQGEVELALAELPTELQNRYRGLREKGRWPVARVKDGSCDACRMTAPAQSLMELKRGRLLACHGCHRWLLMPTAQ